MKAEPKLELTDWMPCTTPPVRDGMYEYDMVSAEKKGSYSLPPLLCEFKYGEWVSLQGINMRPHLFVWRGIRRWVLVYGFTDAPPSYLTRLSEVGSGRHYSADLADAMGFDDAGEAITYAIKHNVRHVTVVLP